jgi:hypothetical protein
MKSNSGNRRGPAAARRESLEHAFVKSRSLGLWTELRNGPSLCIERYLPLVDGAELSRPLGNVEESTKAWSSSSDRVRATKGRPRIRLGRPSPSEESALQTAAGTFMRHWGDTRWRDEIDNVQPTADLAVAGLLRAVASIEDDAYYMQVKLRQAGVLRSPAIRQFNAVWLAEEADHGRAFEALADRLTAERSQLALEHGTAKRDRRAIAALPLMKIAAVDRVASIGGYLVRGAMVEHVAIVVYAALMRRLKEIGEPAGAEIVRRILIQEGRHLKFFASGANTILGGRPVTAAAVRYTTSSTWRPPGVDLMGRRRWVELFQPILGSHEVRQQLLAVDEHLDRLPGLRGAGIVSRYFNRHVDDQQQGAKS